ncbi:hypothetical protein SDC9_142194 [bioreactor metagenome]|uniref:Uncharacterized protein n=1 Tax=bioreactor metagenome TaxID=1076179 RepID=A0A645E2J4_9ZZZZ
MLMMLPAFNQMVKGNKVDQMATTLVLGIEQARSQAAATRKHVALILPSNRATWNDATKKFCYGGYRLAFVEEDGTNWKFVRWLPQSEWKNVPDGALLVYVKTSAVELDTGGGVKNVLGKISGSGSEYSDLESLVVDSSVADMPTGTVDKCALVFTPYGVPNKGELHFVVAEALMSPSDDKIIYPVRESGAALNEKPINHLSFMINQFTGKVEFD